jgi:hypothetical protein
MASSEQAPPHTQFTPPTETVDEFIIPSQYDDARGPSHSASSAYSSQPLPDEQMLLMAPQHLPGLTDHGVCWRQLSDLPAHGNAALTHFNNTFGQGLSDESGSDVTSQTIDCSFL